MWPNAAPGQTAAPAATPDIVVNGRTSRQLSQFVRQMTTVTDNQIGRWRERICSRIYGLDATHSEIIKKIIDGRIGEVGLSVVASPRCYANLEVVVTSDADSYVDQLYRRNTGLFTDPVFGSPPKWYVDAVLRPQPVRWLNVNGLIPSGANPMMRLKTRYRRETTYSLIIVDPARLNGLNWQQLADYIAMVALAEPTPGVSGEADSILSIFSERDAQRVGPGELTDWDRAFLKALYESDSAQNAAAQRKDITLRLIRYVHGKK